MPELPEVETIRHDLEREVAGKRIKSVTITGSRSVRRHADVAALTTRLEGAKIDAVKRRGKYLLVSLGDDWLVVHLGMSGQLRKHAPKDAEAPHTHVIIAFTQGGQLRYVDPRTFGEIFVVAKDELESKVPEISELGFDPVEDVISWNAFGGMLMARKVKLKTLLVDQKFLAGLGNIYSDEVLWAAGLRYDRSSDSLTTQEVRRLYRALVETLHEAIKLRGSTLSDAQYVDLYGKPGSYQGEHRVYARDGLACSRCRAVVVRHKYSSRSTFLCEACQV
jgi:formamidopyrimidine-DNA glycosylase